MRKDGYLYACTCTRRQIEERAAGGSYPGTCRDRGLPFDAPATAWRIRIPEEAVIRIPEWRGKDRRVKLSSALGDFVVRRKDGSPAYQIASLIDDLHFRINFIVRGEDLLASSAAQLFLAGCLGQQSFRRAAFWHHPLLTDEAGAKLSKSKGAGSLKSWREEGRSPITLYKAAGKWLDIRPREIDHAQDLVAAAAAVLKKAPLQS